MSADWVDNLTDRRAVDAVFTDGPPSIDRIDLHAFQVDRDGPVLIVRFDLDDFPANPPAKWRAGGYNVAQLTLRLAGLESFSAQGVAARLIGRLGVTREIGGVGLGFEGDPLSFSAQGKWLLVDALKGYADDARRSDPAGFSPF